MLRGRGKHTNVTQDGTTEPFAMFVNAKRAGGCGRSACEKASVMRAGFAARARTAQVVANPSSTDTVAFGSTLLPWDGFIRSR